MILTFITCLTAAATLISISLSHVTATSHLLPGIPFCVPLNLPPGFYRWWIPILISETVLCGLALYRGLQSYFNRRNLFQSGKELIEILIRDSVLYFLILFGVYLCNTIVFIIGDPTQIESSVGYSVAMSCVMGSRLCLNVRGMVHNDEDLPNLSGEAANPYSSHGRGHRPSMRGTRQGSQGVIIRTLGDSESSVVGQLSGIEMDQLRGMKGGLPK
ncbi:hypothetical protein QCA50_004888 [Cerrena zonata]|uniref:Uncharacterized protein n=1 Tax=Cerrena zonata TaxID=2478898 RepID=A0AAW0GK15_9APHY